MFHLETVMINAVIFFNRLKIYYLINCFVYCLALLCLAKPSVAQGQADKSSRFEIKLYCFIPLFV